MQPFFSYRGTASDSFKPWNFPCQRLGPCPALSIYPLLELGIFKEQTAPKDKFEWTVPFSFASTPCHLYMFGYFSSSRKPNIAKYGVGDWSNS